MLNIRSFDGMTPDIHPSAWIDETALIIGDVHIGPDSSIWPKVVVRGDIKEVRIGARSNIQDGSVLHVSHDSEFLPGGAPLIVGDNVTVGHNVILHGCELRGNCLIGMGSIVMDRVVVQDHVVLGAGSVVPGDKVLESGYLYVGSPARRVRELTEQELKYFGYSAAHYVQLARRHGGAAS
jgi:carbonic anhydrase/acetyltransferase-like protein (isoleucine patch superfamily)